MEWYGPLYDDEHGMNAIAKTTFSAYQSDLSIFFVSFFFCLGCLINIRYIRSQEIRMRKVMRIDTIFYTFLLKQTKRPGMDSIFILCCCCCCCYSPNKKHVKENDSNRNVLRVYQNAINTVVDGTLSEHGEKYVVSDGAADVRMHEWIGKKIKHQFVMVCIRLAIHACAIRFIDVWRTRLFIARHDRWFYASP